MTDVPREIIEEYRKEAIRNVRRTRGKLNLDDLIAINNREFAEQKISAKGSASDSITEEYTVDDCDFMETGYEKSIGKSNRIHAESLEGSKGISSRRSLKRTRTNL